MERMLKRRVAILTILLSSLISCCPKVSTQDVNAVRFLPSVEKDCVELGAVNGGGLTNEESITDVKRNVLKMGGNAAYLVGGSVVLDPTTKETQGVSNAGFAYKCP